MKNGIENNLKNLIFHLTGPPPPFRPSRTGRPGLPPRRRPLARTSAPTGVRTRSPCGRHAPAMHAARQPRPASPSTRSPPSAEQCPPPLLHLIFALAHSAAATAAAHARPRHRAPRLAETRSRDCPSSPLNPPSRPQLRLLLVHLVLASVSHEKLPLLGNLSCGVMAKLIGALHSVDLAPPSSFSLSLRAHEHRTSSVKLPHHLSRPFSAGDGWPSVSRTTAPPCMPPSFIMSSSCAFTWCTASASSRVSCWW